VDSPGELGALEGASAHEKHIHFEGSGFVEYIVTLALLGASVLLGSGAVTVADSVNDVKKPLRRRLCTTATRRTRRMWVHPFW
jgi:hypothetical protein